MDILNNLLLGFSVACTPENLMYLTLGCVIGTMIGVLPGIGPIATISMMLPLTFTIGPIPSMIMLSGIFYGAQYGGSTTSILLNMPGEMSSTITTVDGYKMTQQGRGGIAIVTAGVVSLIGGIVATILIVVASPPLSEFAFKMGPAEYTILMLLGFISVGVLTTGDMLKGIGICIVGILLGMVGTDTSNGLERFSFNIPDLLDGVGVANLAVGIFGFSEIMKNISNVDQVKVYDGKLSMFPTKQDWIRMIPAGIRGSAIGSFFGLVPGGGATLASYGAYAVEKKVSKYKDELGTGAIEGVAAPEAANNSAAQSGFIPLLCLGIPENAVMALLLGAMYLSGIQPGPGIVTKQPDLFWGLIVSMLIGNIILVILNVPLVRIWIQVLKVPYKVLYPVILAICCMGVYSVNNNPNDILITALFGFLGYLFVELEIEPAPLMLGVILGPMFEEYFRRHMGLYNGEWSSFLDRPISVALLSLLGMVIVYGVYSLCRKKK